ncbi:MAG: hypothetical protein WC519_01715 [Parcubacteria group bacterium]
MEHLALLPPVKLPSGLREKILKEIAKKEKGAAVFKTVAFGIFSLVFTASSVSAFIWMVNTVRQSGLGSYFSLIFSDSRIILSAWSEFFAALLETVPITELIVTLVLTLASLWSVSMVAKNIYLIRPAIVIRK